MLPDRPHKLQAVNPPALRTVLSPMDEEALARRLEESSQRASSQAAPLYPPRSSVPHQSQPPRPSQQYSRGGAPGLRHGVSGAQYSSAARAPAGGKAPWAGPFASLPHAVAGAPPAPSPRIKAESMRGVSGEDNGAGAISPRARRMEEARLAGMSSQPDNAPPCSSAPAWAPHQPAPGTGADSAASRLSISSLVALGAATAAGLNEQQRRAANHPAEIPLVIFAPAGAGKVRTPPPNARLEPTSPSVPVLPPWSLSR
jgi:hypothetical protein